MVNVNLLMFVEIPKYESATRRKIFTRNKINKKKRNGEKNT